MSIIKKRYSETNILIIILLSKLVLRVTSRVSKERVSSKAEVIRDNILVFVLTFYFNYRKILIEWNHVVTETN